MGRGFMVRPSIAIYVLYIHCHYLEPAEDAVKALESGDSRFTEIES